jgi:hypothetical protein
MGNLILGVIIGIGIMLYINNKRKKELPALDSKPGQNSAVVTTVEKKEDEVDRIHKEAEKIKRRAEELGVLKLFEDIYFHEIKYYPSWIKNSHDYVPSIVTSAIEEKNEGEDEDKENIRLALNGKEYLLTFKENSFSTPDGEGHLHGDLEVFLNDKKILALSASFDYDYEKWGVFEIDAFIEGDWISDFKKLSHEIEVLAKEREKKERAGKAKELKKNFNIE